MPQRPFLLFVGLFAALTASAAPEPAALDHVVVIVNNGVITATELELRLRDVRRRIEEQKLSAPPVDVLRKQVLEHLIIERIQLQQARELGIQASEERVTETLRQIAQRNKAASAEAFLAGLERDGFPRKWFRNEVQTQLLLQQLTEREVMARIQVTETEVQQVLERRRSEGPQSEYQLSHLMIPVPESATPQAIEAARLEAERLAGELRRGADFARLAIAHSKGQNALDGGRLGWKQAAQLPNLFVQALDAIQPGQVTPPIRSPNGFHLLKLHERRGGTAQRQATFTHARHILLRSSPLLPPEEAERRLLSLRSRIQHGEDFAALARANSDDTGSATNGGDLGWAPPGQMVPEFEQAMAALKPGEFSGVVRTAFGFHLIQVLAREVRDVTDQIEQAQVRSQLHARKSEERQEQWLRQLRAEAYVEYRDDSLR